MPDTLTDEQVGIGVALTDEDVGIATPKVVRSATPGSLNADQLLPAVRLIGGETVTGKPGDTHPKIIDREGISAKDLDQRGFTGPGGVFLDREAAAQGTGLPTQFESGRLHSTDLINAADTLSPPKSGLELAARHFELGGRRMAQPPKARELIEGSGTMVEPTEGFQIPRVTPPSDAGVVEKVAAGLANTIGGVANFALSPEGIAAAAVPELIPAKYAKPLLKGIFGGTLAKAAGEQLGKAWVTKDPQDITEGILAAAASLGIPLAKSLPKRKEPDPARVLEMPPESGRSGGAGEARPVAAPTPTTPPEPPVEKSPPVPETQEAPPVAPTEGKSETAPVVAPTGDSEPAISESKPVEELVQAQPETANSKAQAAINKTVTTEGVTSGKEAKATWIYELNKAIAEAASEDKYPGLKKEREAMSKHRYLPDKSLWDKAKEEIGTVTIDIPGDGKTTILNTKEALQAVLDKAKKISTSSGEPAKITRRGTSNEDKAWVQEQLAKPGIVPESTPAPAPAPQSTLANPNKMVELEAVVKGEPKTVKVKAQTALDHFTKRIEMLDKLSLCLAGK